VSLSPYSDNVNRDVKDSNKILIPISVEGANSYLIFPSAEEPSMPEYQLPLNDQDLDLQVTLPIVHYLMGKIEVSLGRYNENCPKKKIFKMAVESLKGKLSLPPSILKSVEDNSVNLHELYQQMKGMGQTPYDARLITLLEMYFLWLQNHRTERGYRDHFYLCSQPAFLNYDFPGICHGFYTNGIPSEFDINKVVEDIDGERSVHDGYT